MSVRAESISPSRVSPFTAFRFAFRELRGGVRGFYVLILCIALGVMAIAGVGSFSESLTGGLAREGRTILGGDAAFSLIHREASDRRECNSCKAADRCRSPPPCARWRACRPTRCRWLRSRRSTMPIRWSARPRPNRRCRSPMLLPNAAMSSARWPIRPCWCGSISSRAGALRLAPRPSKSARPCATNPTSSRAASASARAF